MNTAKLNWRTTGSEEVALPPIPKLRLRYVDNCRHCKGIHFTHAAYLECAMNAQEQGQPEGR